jgi:Domain of unknown function (DUF4145)
MCKLPIAGALPKNPYLLKHYLGRGRGFWAEFQTWSFAMKNDVLDEEKVEVENTGGADLDAPGLLEFLCRPLTILWKDWPKHMDVTLLEMKGSRFSLSGLCPHCNGRSVFNCVTNTFIRDIPGRRGYEWAAAMQCPGCLRYVLGVVEAAGNPPRLSYQAHYPLGAPDDSVDESVPASIASDFSEALRCLWVKSYKAAVAMCRRAVEVSCADLKASGKNLKEKIDDLANKGIITEPLKQMAHRVRLTANEKLHGKDDDLDAFTEQDAEAIVKCVREYFHHVYVMPALLRDYEQRQAGSSTPPPAASTP